MPCGDNITTEVSGFFYFFFNGAVNTLKNLESSAEPGWTGWPPFFTVLLTNIFNISCCYKPLASFLANISFNSLKTSGFQNKRIIYSLFFLPVPVLGSSHKADIFAT